MIFNTFTIGLLDSPELIFSLEFIQYKLSILFQEKESKPKVSFLVHFSVSLNFQYLMFNCAAYRGTTLNLKVPHSFI